MKNFQIIALPSLALAIGHIFPGECPQAPDQVDFDIEKYAGVWYNHLANDYKNIPENAECVSATYQILDEETISVNNSATINSGIANRPLKINSWAFGTGTVLDPEFPTQLYVDLNEFGGCGEHAWFCGSTGNTKDNIDDIVNDGPYINYQVAETDYENYTVVISCYPINDTDTHSEITYIMSRDRQWPLTTEGKQKVQEIIYNLEQWGYNTDTLTYTKQDIC